jgi:hypothetical protein
VSIILNSKYSAINEFCTEEFFMARIFNICFNYKDKPYTALIFISGKQENDHYVKVTTYEENIQIILPRGRLIFPISEVMQRLLVALQNDSPEHTLHITENITIQLMNTAW